MEQIPSKREVKHSEPLRDQTLIVLNAKQFASFCSTFLIYFLLTKMSTTKVAWQQGK